jgi:hypothetical protein
MVATSENSIHGVCLVANRPIRNVAGRCNGFGLRRLLQIFATRSCEAGRRREPRGGQRREPMKRAVVRSFRAVVVALAVAGLAGCESPPREIEFDTSAEHGQTADGLFRVKTTRIGRAWLRPGNSFAAYDAVLIDPVSVSYKNPPVSSYARDRRCNFLLSDGDKQRLARIFQESFELQLGGSEVYDVVTEAGPNVLRVSGHIVDLVVSVPRQTGSDRLFVMNVGEMTLVLDVRDSLTGRALARIADRRAISRGVGGNVATFESDAVNNWNVVRQITRDWARFLREGLDDLSSLSLESPRGAPATDSPADAPRP